MKKIFAFLLTLAMLLSLCACGGSGGDGAAPDQASGTEEKNDPAPEQSSAPASGYLTYDDLTNTENFWVRLDEGDIQLQCDYPSGFCFGTHGNGMGSENSLAFSIVVAHAKQPMPDTSLEDAFAALLNGDFHSVLKQVNRASYGEVTPETELVTLDCGREAVRFSGIQPVDDYGTLYDASLWGYCTLVDEIPVIVCYVIFDEEALEEDRLAELDRYYAPDELARYVEEMINTVRIAE